MRSSTWARVASASYATTCIRMRALSGIVPGVDLRREPLKS
jgi:hypothetical protein